MNCMNTERGNYSTAVWQTRSGDFRRLQPEQMMVLSFATEVNAILGYVNRSTAPRHVK